MREHMARTAAAAAVSLFVLAVPARAQSFLSGSAETIWAGNFRLTGAPVHMFGRDGAPDRTGGAFRLGYGISESFDVEAASAFFDGTTLLGGDVKFQALDHGETSLAFSAGGHWAQVSHGLDSSALDLGVELSQRIGQRLEVYGGAIFSREATEGPTGTDFSRFYVVPGVRVGVAEKLDLVVESGLGLNDDSPHYLTAGLALYLPVAANARGRAR
jgi:hypothetical protein